MKLTIVIIDNGGPVVDLQLDALTFRALQKLLTGVPASEVAYMEHQALEKLAELVARVRATDLF